MLFIQYYVKEKDVSRKTNLNALDRLITKTHHTHKIIKLGVKDWKRSIHFFSSCSILKKGGETKKPIHFIKNVSYPRKITWNFNHGSHCQQEQYIL